MELELSVHQLGADLRHEAANIFPDAPAASGQASLHCQLFSTPLAAWSPAFIQIRCC